MAKLHDLVKSLIVELVKSQEPDAFLEKIQGVPTFSGFVSAGDKGSLVLTQSMDKLIKEIGDVLKTNDPILMRSHTDKEWIRLVRAAFGPPLVAINLADDLDDNSNTVMTLVREALSERADNNVCEYTFGCTLFGSNSVAPFVIGQIRFEPRLEWLLRKMKEGAVTSVMERRIRRHWSGKKIRKRKTVIDGMRETDILNAIKNCDYVCSVATTGLASDAGRGKAQTAARLGLTSIALWWELPSRALDGLNLLIDGAVVLQMSLVFVPEKITLAGSFMRGLPHGPSIAPAVWVDILLNHKNEFSVLGELIEFYLSPNRKVDRPKLMNTFSQALLWFHEGCREKFDLMAIVKFAATLDILASGREAAGILELIKARLGPAPDDKFGTNGQTTKQAIKEIYGMGRSRTIHGTNDKFGHDWTSTRGFSEVVARLCLLSCLSWAGTNTADDPELLRQ
jgi:hypothetical protein